VALRNTFEACAFVDGLGTSATGEIVVSDDRGPRGTIFVERGRVCWAAAQGMARRLTELLGRRAGLAPPAMEALFLECKARRVPLGEHLSSSGVLGPEELRDALLQHTIESLLRLWASEARAAWCPRTGNGYNPRFTFATSELLTHVGALSHAAVAAEVQPRLDGLFGDGDWAAAFVRTETSAFPEPVAVIGALPRAATTVMRLGKWAASALDVATTFSDESALLSVARGPSAPGASLVAFRLGATVVAGETGTHGPARILNRRAQRRRARG
jgi:hypothetical protein